MYIVHILIRRSKSARPKENAPHKAGHYLILVARGGIELGPEDVDPALDYPVITSP